MKQPILALVAVAGVSLVAIPLPAAAQAAPTVAAALPEAPLTR